MPGDGALFGIAHAHIYTPYFPPGWGIQGKVFFGRERRIQGEGEAMTPKNNNYKEHLNW